MVECLCSVDPLLHLFRGGDSIRGIVGYALKVTVTYVCEF